MTTRYASSIPSPPLLSHEASDEQQDFLTEAQCRAIFDQCVAEAGNDCQINLTTSSWHEGVLQWARNRAHTSKDIHGLRIELSVLNRGRRGQVTITRADTAAISDAIRTAKSELLKDIGRVSQDTRIPPKNRQRPILHPKLWSEASAAFDGVQRSAVARQLIDEAEEAKLLTAGDLSTRTSADSTWSSDGVARYYRSTRVAFSTTVRDRQGTASGWAGVDDFDVARIDMKALGHRALDKCRRSANPVAVEPGRYTAILEPQAVADLFQPVVQTFSRPESEDPTKQMPFYRSPGRSKIGERVLDPRLTISADPMDPIGGFLPFHEVFGDPYVPVEWIKDGIVRELAYDDFWGIPNLGIDKQLSNSTSWRMSGGTATTEEMIATTKRGLLVTRLHGVKMFHGPSVTCTGYTRDGIWLVENGKITKPVKNFRFTESPLFVFNRVEQIGEVRRVFTNHPLRAVVAPTVKVRDFNFTQLADAV